MVLDMEKINERTKEREPSETLYDQAYRNMEEAARKREEGRVIIRGRDIPFQQGRQALLKNLLHEKDWDKVAVPDWAIFVNRILVQSGKHTHQGGLVIYVLDGMGHTVVDGVRYDWERGDLIVLPVKPGGVEHQHFNEDPNVSCEWIAFVFRGMLKSIGFRIEQKEEHPDWGRQGP